MYGIDSTGYGNLAITFYLPTRRLTFIFESHLFNQTFRKLRNISSSRHSFCLIIAILASPIAGDQEEQRMNANEFYRIDPKKGSQIIRVLPERRKNPERITQKAIVNWGDEICWKRIRYQRYFCHSSHDRRKPLEFIGLFHSL